MRHRSRPVSHSANSIAAAFILILATGCFSRSDYWDVRQRDWLVVTGEAVIQPLGPKGRRHADAVSAAEGEARKKFQEHFAVAEVNPGVTVLQAMERDAYVWSKVQGTLEATRSYKHIEEADERIVVYMRVDMDMIRDVCLRKEEAPGTGEDQVN